MDIKEVAKKYADYQIEMRRHFHENPEVSTKEFNTCERIREELTAMGVEWRPCGIETGTLATIRGAKPGKTILLRGDIDALAQTEDTGLPFASKNPGVMHACGHDCHISMLLTAAHLLHDMQEDLCGTVKLAFQPAEEVAIGAKAMIADGALDGVDACFGIHVWYDVPVNHIFCNPGPCMGAANMFNIEVSGKGGHGATPDVCIDAVVVQAAIVNNLQTMVSREYPPMEPAVVTIGKVEAGSRWNVIAETAHLEGTGRCFSKEIFDNMPSVIDRIAKETAAAYRAEVSTYHEVLVPPVINDEKIAKVVQGASRKVMNPDAPITIPPTMGGEDFAYYMEKVPGAICQLGIRNEEIGACYPQHSPHFLVDESALLQGAMLYAQTALDFNAGE